MRTGEAEELRRDLLRARARELRAIDVATKAQTSLDAEEHSSPQQVVVHVNTVRGLLANIIRILTGGGP